MSRHLNTGKVLIGIAYVPRQHQPMSSCALTLQAALLDPRTAKPRPMLARIAGMFWRWC